MKKSLYTIGVTIALCFLAFGLGWFGSQHYRKSIPMPMGTARIEVPRGCKPRLWMNAVETDCKDGAHIYYVSKLEHASPQ